MAAGRAGRRDRRVGDVPESAADVSSPQRRRGRSLPSGLAGQPSNDRSAPEPVPAGQGPPRPRDRQGLGAPDAALRAGDTLTGNAPDHLVEVFAADDPTGKPQAVWKVKEQLRVLLRTRSLSDAAAAKEDLQILVEAAARPETNKLYRSVCRWWNKIEVLIVTGATTGNVEANNTCVIHIKRNRLRLREPRQLQIDYSHEKRRPDGDMTFIGKSTSPGTVQSHFRRHTL